MGDTDERGNEKARQGGQLVVTHGQTEKASGVTHIGKKEVTLNRISYKLKIE